MGEHGVEGANSNSIIHICHSDGCGWKWGGRSKQKHLEFIYVAMFVIGGKGVEGANSKTKITGQCTLKNP